MSDCPLLREPRGERSDEDAEHNVTSGEVAPRGASCGEGTFGSAPLGETAPANSSGGGPSRGQKRKAIAVLSAAELGRRTLNSAIARRLEKEAAAKEVQDRALPVANTTHPAGGPLPAQSGTRGGTYARSGPTMLKETAREWVQDIYKSSKTASVIDVENPPSAFAFRLLGDDNYKRTGSTSHYSKSYSAYHHLLHVNTYKHSGWMVCSYAVNPKTSYLCPLASEGAVRKFNPGMGGISSLEKHTAGHLARIAELEVPRPLADFSAEAKRGVADAAVSVVAHDLRPFTFMEGKGMKRVMSACVKAGQSLPAGQEFDLDKLVPSDTCVKNRLTSLVATQRRKVSGGEIDGILRQGGGMSTDGWTCKATNHHFYDVTIYYVGEVPASGDTGLSHSIAGSVKSETYDVEIMCRTLALIPHRGSKAADHIRYELDEGLKNRFGPEKGLHAFLSSRTLVTDSDPSMPKIVGSSVSPNVAKPDDKWTGCLSHQYNTVARHAFTDENLRRHGLHSVVDFLKAVKTIVRIFKQGAGNSNLPIGDLLREEGDTRFLSKLPMIERFARALFRVQSVVRAGSNQPAKAALSKVSQVDCANSRVECPEAEISIEVLQIMNFGVTKLEGRKIPTIGLALPVIEETCRLLRVLSAGSEFRNRRGNIATASAALENMAICLLEQFPLRMRLNPLYTVACLIHPHPSINTLLFLGRNGPALEAVFGKTKEELLAEGMELLRRMCSETRAAMKKRSKAAPAASGSNAFMTGLANHSRNSGGVNVDGNARGVRGLDFNALLVDDDEMGTAVESDEISNFLSRKLTAAQKERIRLDGEKACLRYWAVDKAFPELREVAYRVLATPASSCESERLFSVLTRLLTKLRMRLADGTVDDIMFFRSNESLEDDLPSEDGSELSSEDLEKAFDALSGLGDDPLPDFEC